MKHCTYINCIKIYIYVKQLRWVAGRMISYWFQSLAEVVQSQCPELLLSPRAAFTLTRWFSSLLNVWKYIYLKKGCVPKMGRFLSLRDDFHRLADLFKLMMYCETFTGNAESESGSSCSVSAAEFDKTFKEPSISACGRRLHQTRVLFRCVPAAYSQYF